MKIERAQMVQNVGEGAIAVVPQNYCRGLWSQAGVRDLWAGPRQYGSTFPGG